MYGRIFLATLCLVLAFGASGPPANADGAGSWRPHPKVGNGNGNGNVGNNNGNGDWGSFNGNFNYGSDWGNNLRGDFQGNFSRDPHYKKTPRSGAGMDGDYP